MVKMSNKKNHWFPCRDRKKAFGSYRNLRKKETKGGVGGDVNAAHHALSLPAAMKYQPPSWQSLFFVSLEQFVAAE